MSMVPITLASRDSLLALTQTIEAAERLEKVGFIPQIQTMKTAGDIKLNAPLYEVAQQAAEKEGRAFFTRELDDALLKEHADAAVHSFKDLPTENVKGISKPIFFSQEKTNDTLLLRKGTPLTPDGAGLVIGTSSLRRMHQLQFLMPQANTLTLRGNIITRLTKLTEGANGMNAILIAHAGLNRVENFARKAEATYARFLDKATLEAIRAELQRFANALKQNFVRREIPETIFPTAPGQGVLAVQLSVSSHKKMGEKVRSAFPEHTTIEERVEFEREVMVELMAGCHAPLGVSVFEKADSDLRLASACYSRVTTTNPVTFSKTVFINRFVKAGNSKLSVELKEKPSKIYWWGLRNPLKNAQSAEVPIFFIPAITQNFLLDGVPPTTTDTLFVASAAVVPWLQAHEREANLPLWTPGEETARAVKEALPKSFIERVSPKSFGAALLLIDPARRLLWLGSKNGEERARRAARTRANTNFLPVYENLFAEPKTIEELLANENSAREKDAVHILTSAASASVFVEWANSVGLTNERVFCFGTSAVEVLEEAARPLYMVSDAPDFALFLREIVGDPALIGERWQEFLKEKHET